MSSERGAHPTQRLRRRRCVPAGQAQDRRHRWISSRRRKGLLAVLCPDRGGAAGQRHDPPSVKKIRRPKLRRPAEWAEEDGEPYGADPPWNSIVRRQETAQRSSCLDTPPCHPGDLGQSLVRKTGCRDWKVARDSRRLLRWVRVVLHPTAKCRAVKARPPTRLPTRIPAKAPKKQPAVE